MGETLPLSHCSNIHCAAQNSRLIGYHGAIFPIKFPRIMHIFWATQQNIRNINGLSGQSRLLKTSPTPLSCKVARQIPNTGRPFGTPQSGGAQWGIGWLEPQRL